jgi:hypothetical protein
MANPDRHACSSAKRWGGEPADYQAIHDWLHASKVFMPDFRHLALRHRAQAIFECERVFGPAIKNSAGRPIPVQWIGGQHVLEDCGRIPAIQDWFQHIRPEHWMGQPLINPRKHCPTWTRNSPARLTTAGIVTLAGRLMQLCGLNRQRQMAGSHRRRPSPEKRGTGPRT